MKTSNPFTPAFGTIPAIVAGREGIFEAMRTAFEAGPGNPNLSTILMGPRGTGKTVCMSCICDDALEYGWISVRTTAKQGMLEDIYEQCLRVGKDYIDYEKLILSSLSVGPISASWTTPESPIGNWRSRMTDVLDTLAEHGVGLVIAVDEVRAVEPEMIELAAVFQLFVTEQRKVALLMAGLPHNVHQLLNDESVSFLRRSMQHRLERIEDDETSNALKQTIEGAGRSISPDALNACTQAARGFAYMIQLVGYRTWNVADEDLISLNDANRGITLAQADMEEHIYRSTYRELSDGDIAFLKAMLEDPVESRLATVSKRLGVKSNYATKYKARLLAQGVIEGRGRSTIFGFAIPGFRDFLIKELGV